MSKENKLELIKASIQRLYSQGVTDFISGGALGFDTICANAVIEQRKKYSDIRLILVLPCKDQHKYWSIKQREEYIYLIDNADEVIYLNEKYITGCMHERNRYMIDHAKYLITYCTKSTGGTYYTLEYARRKGRIISNIAGGFDI